MLAAGTVMIFDSLYEWSSRALPVGIDPRTWSRSGSERNEAHRRQFAEGWGSADGGEPVSRDPLRAHWTVVKSDRHRRQGCTRTTNSYSEIEDHSRRRRAFEWTVDAELSEESARH